MEEIKPNPFLNVAKRGGGTRTPDLYRVKTHLTSPFKEPMRSAAR
jgi:hypothetical protein